jgi:DeoR family fructose operon transcriptional repressor
MLTEERQARILEVLSESKKGVVTVSALSQLFSVSGMTIRRDLSRLEEAGLVRRVHGGAVSYEGVVYEKPFLTREEEYGREKQEIGRLAAQMIANGQTIILDAGTTTQQIARNLAQKEGLTVVTHAIPVAVALSNYLRIQTIMLGGMLKRKELCMVGPPVIEELSRMSVDKLFLSAAGFTVERGATDPDIRETEVKRAMVKAAKEVILVADSSKYGYVAFAQIAPLRAIHTIVTDEGLPAGAIEAIEAEGLKVITPGRLTISETG